MAVARETHPWSALLDEGREDKRLVREAFDGARAPELEDLPEMDERLVAALNKQGIHQLYSHQAQAFEAAFAGPTIVTTGTASGKSMCFNLPVLETLLADPMARALYLYPTKALSQDQARGLHQFGLGKAVRPAIYDGDTQREERAAIRKNANVILTNPDMLHMGILPNHRVWANYFSNLAFVVVDEAHVYRGVFGSHVANVLRRLRRIAAAYGTAPRILFTSATIANPIELAERLSGLDPVRLVDHDGAPGAKRQIAMWNPPVLDEALQTRRSALSEAADVIAELVRGGARTICFVKSRRGVELVAKIVSDRMIDEDPELARRVAPYRAGYTPQQRREIEAKLTNGDLLAVITTDALELGIDIGALDAAVVVTFPGTVASLRQMWGRAGRRGRGLALYIAGEDALDQFFCRHPDEFLERGVEAALVNYENEQIHNQHLLCAAHEGPIDPERDAEFLGPRVLAHCEHLEGLGELVKRRGKYTLKSPQDYPAARVSLRSADARRFAIVNATSGEVMGDVEGSRAHDTVHEGAIYLHQGRSYSVRELDLDDDRAIVEPFDGDWYTQPKKETETQIERLLDQRETMGVKLNFGIVSVTETVLAYQRKRLPGHEEIDMISLDLPTTTFQTQALWYEYDDDLLGLGFPLETMLGALHATEHSQIAVLPLLAMCDRWDIGGLSTNAHPQTTKPTIFIYDGHPGGVGITLQGYREFEALVGDAHRLVSECKCESGCPSCVQSPKCGNLNEPLSKIGAIELMARMLEH